MNKYIVTVKSTYGEKELKRYGVIVFKSMFIKNLYGINSSFKKEYLETLYFVEKIEKSSEGKFLENEDNELQTYIEKINMLEKQNGNILSAYEDMKKERDGLLEFKLMVQEHKNNDFLYYDGDVENFIASCVNDLPIVIRADDLRFLLSKEKES